MACAIWVPRRLEAPGETRRMTARYASLWNLQKPPKEFVLYKRQENAIQRMAEAALDASKKQNPEGQASFDQTVQDILEEYPELKRGNEPLQQPSDYVDPGLYKYASVDFSRLGLEIVGLSALCFACLVLVKKAR